MTIASAIWLEEDDDLYDAPLSDLKLRAYLAANGIDPNHCRDHIDSDKWRWFETIPLPTADDDDD
jgi:hypothetical protein